jgi:hypothetical protein
MELVLKICCQTDPREVAVIEMKRRNDCAKASENRVVDWRERARWVRLI